MINKLKNKITLLVAAGNLLILVLLIAIGFAVTDSMHRLSAITAQLYEDPFTVNNAAQVVKFDIENIRDHMLEIAISRDSKRADALSGHMASLDRSASEQLRVVETSFLGDPEKVKEAHRLLDEWRDVMVRTIDLAARGQWDQVQNLVAAGNRTTFLRLEADVDYIVAFTRYRADAFVKEANSEAATVTRRIVLLLASFAIVILIVGSLVSRRTWRMIRAEEVATEAIAKAEKRYRSLFENMLEGYVHGRLIYEGGKPQDFTFLDVNDSFKHIMGHGEVVGRKVNEVIPGMQQSDPQMLETFGSVAATGKPVQLETYVKALQKWFSISVYSTEPESFNALCNDITGRKNYEQQMRLSESIFHASSEAMVITDSQKNIIRVNPAFTEITGYAPDEVLGKSAPELCAGHHDEDFYKEMNHSLAATGHWEGEVWDKKKCGDAYAVRIIINSIKGDPGSARSYSAQFSDITEKKKKDEALSKHANSRSSHGLVQPAHVSRSSGPGDQESAPFP